MPIVDTHLHVLDHRRLSYPWVANYPQLNGNYLYETYAPEARRLGISATLQMEVDVPREEIEDEATMAEDLRSRLGPPMAGAISSCRPEEPAFPTFLEAQCNRPFVKGFRRVLHVVPDGVSRAPLFRENVRRIGAAGFPFDLCVFQRQLLIAADLIDACPATLFILDHCGQPEMNPGAWPAWAAGITDIARRPNVAVKISGLPAYLGKALDSNVEDLRPYVEHCIGAFGWSRVMWGSDWPICLAGGSLNDWVNATLALLAGCSPGERRQLLEINARRTYSLE